MNDPIDDATLENFQWPRKSYGYKINEENKVLLKM